MNDEEIISNKIARYMAEAGGDPRGAMRLMAIDLHRLGDMVSLGFGRLAPVDKPRFLPKPKAPSIDDPKTGVESQSTLD